MEWIDPNEELPPYDGEFLVNFGAKPLVCFYDGIGFKLKFNDETYTNKYTLLNEWKYIPGKIKRYGKKEQWL